MLVEDYYLNVLFRCFTVVSALLNIVVHYAFALLRNNNPVLIDFINLLQVCDSFTSCSVYDIKHLLRKALFNTPGVVAAATKLVVTTVFLVIESISLRLYSGGYLSII